MIPYVYPKFNESKFNCPLCNAYSVQRWYGATPDFPQYEHDTEYAQKTKKVAYCFCLSCGDYTIWVDKKIIFPLINGAPLPNPDMPTEVKDVYEEGRSIMSKSPRSACALLRLALEILLDDINGKNKKSLNQNIGILVSANKIAPEIKQSMDILRVTGDAVLHPAIIDIENTEKPETAIKMFELLNIVTKTLISDPKLIQEYYDSNIPQPQKDAIDKRDGEK